MSFCEVQPFTILDQLFAETLCPEHSCFHPLLSSLMAAARAGHLCIPCAPEQALPEHLVARDPAEDFPDRPLCLSHDLLYLQRNWVFETRFLKHLKRLLRTPIPAKAPRLSSDLNAEQAEAVRCALSSNLSLITGGPGTGKSYVAAKLVEALDEPCRILACAPTGRAAAQLGARLSAHPHVKWGTLHALLQIKSAADFAKQGALLPADLILVDECSMIDVRLFSYLLASVQEGTRLVLMGDKDQLPPVESGSLFADLIEILPCSTLTKSLRSDQKEVLHLAQAIKEGDEEEVLKQVRSVDYNSLIHEVFPPPSAELPDPNLLMQAMDRFRILSCVRGGPMGVDTLNAAIAGSLSKKLKADQFWSAPILITRSDYALELYNGDTGILVYKGKQPEYALFKTGQAFRNIPARALPPFEYAYCLSVHKSQGSEYERVLLLVPPGSEVFGREVLYTAATRAKQRIEIDGDSETIRGALRRSSRKRSGISMRFSLG
jgi:exodeoxyribonuclease V alpha subunit